MDGIGFLEFMGRLHGMRSTERRDELIRYFDADIRTSLSRMSKGMKQKIAIISAFMHRPSILVMDEPTDGLDPLMQRKFNELLLQEKENGTTIFMSSHNFEEIERTCSRVGIIRQGRIIAVEETESLYRGKQHKFTIAMSSENDVDTLLRICRCKVIYRNANIITVVCGDINEFIHAVSRFNVTDMRTEEISLEELFMQYYSMES